MALPPDALWLDHNHVYKRGIFKYRVANQGSYRRLPISKCLLGLEKKKDSDSIAPGISYVIPPSQRVKRGMSRFCARTRDDSQAHFEAF